MHGRELAPQRKISVLVSDPQRKKDRSDARANDAELYISNLASFTTEADLRALFEPFGAIKRIGFEATANGKCRGFSFVEFETEVRRCC